MRFLGLGLVFGLLSTVLCGKNLLILQEAAITDIF